MLDHSSWEGKASSLSPNIVLANFRGVQPLVGGAIVLTVLSNHGLDVFEFHISNYGGEGSGLNEYLTPCKINKKYAALSDVN